MVAKIKLGVPSWFQMSQTPGPFGPRAEAHMPLPSPNYRPLMGDQAPVFPFDKFDTWSDEASLTHRA